MEAIKTTGVGGSATSPQGLCISGYVNLGTLPKPKVNAEGALRAQDSRFLLVNESWGHCLEPKKAFCHVGGGIGEYLVGQGFGRKCLVSLVNGVLGAAHVLLRPPDGELVENPWPSQ